MSRLAATREDLDDDHPAATAWAGAGQNARLVRRGGLLVLRLNGARYGTEQLASTGDVGGAATIGKQAVATNAVEALGQHVHQEAADELVSCERHGLPPVWPVYAVVLPAKGDTGVVGRDQTAIGDGDAMV